jgi:uncharacterized membrane protein
MAKNVVGLFDDQAEAESAVRDLLEAGIRREDVSVVSSDPEGRYRKETVDEEGNLAGEGAATGAASGAVVGGIVGLLIGVGTLAFPAAGIVAAGPIAGLLAGAGAGAVAGGIIGALIGLGIPEEHAETYAESVRRGSVVVAVHCDDVQADMVADVMDRYNAVDIEERTEAYRRENIRFDESRPVLTPEEAQAERERIRSGAYRSETQERRARRARTYEGRARMM